MSDYPPRSPFTTPLELSLVEMVHERCETWKNTLNAIIEYFNIMVDLEKTKERTFKRAAALLGPSNVFGTSSVEDSPTSGTDTPPKSPKTFGSLNTWLVPLQALAIKGNSESEAMVRYTEKVTMPELGHLREQIKMGSKQLREQLAMILGPLHKAHESLNAAMGQHQTVWSGLIEGKDPRAEEGTDPWLLQIRLSLKINAFLREKEVFCQALEAVHENQQQLDSAWTSSLLRIIQEFFTVQAKSTLQHGEQMKDVSELMQSLDIPSEWNSALGHYRLDFRWKLETPPFDGFFSSVIGQIGLGILSRQERRQSISSEIVKVFPIVKTGFIMRQSGGGFAGKSWHTLFWVLVESGFLHGYSKIASTGQMPKHNQAISRKTLQEFNNEAAKSLFEGIVPDSLVIEPSVSIWLGGGSVAPAIETSTSSGGKVDSSGCTFLVTSGAIVSGGGFLFGGKGEKKHLLQSFVEEDMVDWCIAIKQVIEAISQQKFTLEVSTRKRQSNTPSHEPEEGSFPEQNRSQVHQSSTSQHDEYQDSEPEISVYYSEENNYKFEQTGASSMLPPELEKNPWE